jgi:hypothetical protein
MADRERGFGDEFAKASGDAFDVFDAVVQEEDLPAAVEFAQDCFSDQVVAGFGDEGADG